MAIFRMSKFIWVISLSAAFLANCSGDHQKSTLVPLGSILYGLNGTIWEFDLTTNQSQQVTSLHSEEDSAVYSSGKINIIYDTFDPNSATRTHNLYYTPRQSLMTHNHVSGAAHVGMSDPSICQNTDQILALKRQIDLNDPSVVLNTELVKMDINGTVSQNYGPISIDSANLGCSNDGERVLYSDFNRATGFSNIVIWNLVAGTIDILTNPNLDCDAQTWSSDNQWIYATCSGAIYKMRPFNDPQTNFAADMTIIEAATPEAEFYGPVSSPAGNHIAIEQYNSTDDGIYIIDLGSGAKTKTNIQMGAMLSDWR